MVQHGEIQAVCAGDINQLFARCITNAGPLDLNDICPKPCQQLGAGGAIAAVQGGAEDRASPLSFSLLRPSGGAEIVH